MDGRVEGWMHAWMMMAHEWMDMCMSVWMDACMDELCGWMDACMDECMDEWMRGPDG
jgi:hypothetical protein